MQKLFRKLPAGVLIYQRDRLLFGNNLAHSLLGIAPSYGQNEDESLTHLALAVQGNEQLRLVLSDSEGCNSARSMVGEAQDESLLAQPSQRVKYVAKGTEDEKPLGVNTITLELYGAEYKVSILQDQSVYEELQRERLAKKYLKDFFAMITHELRNPLNGVLGIFESLNDRLSQHAGVEAEREEIGQCQMGISTVRLMMQLVNDILDLSQMESNAFRLTEEKVDIAALVEECIRLIQFKYRAKGVSLFSTIDGELPARFCCDRNRYMQILLNLLGNAIKFTDRGEVRVTLRYDRITGFLHTAVKDTGAGIRDEDKCKLFQLFGRLDDPAAKNPQGVGLGLHICKKLTEAMGGKIELESEYTRGTTITFSVRNKCEPVTVARTEAVIIIPMSENHMTQQSIPTEKCAKESFYGCNNNLPFVHSPGSFMRTARTVSTTFGPATSRPKSALVVDDEFLSIQAVQTYLRRCGCDSDSAISGTQALESMSRNRSGYKLVFVDVNMPVMGGVETVRKMREMCRGERVPFIVGMTGDSAMEDQCAQAGMDRIRMSGYVLRICSDKTADEGERGETGGRAEEGGCLIIIDRSGSLFC